MHPYEKNPTTYRLAGVGIVGFLVATLLLVAFPGITETRQLVAYEVIHRQFMQSEQIPVTDTCTEKDEFDNCTYLDEPSESVYVLVAQREGVPMAFYVPRSYFYSTPEGHFIPVIETRSRLTGTLRAADIAYKTEPTKN